MSTDIYPALGAYIGFLGIIWFTWLQVTLFDIRFARDSVFERVCKAVQLGAMVGFASAGSRFSTRVQEENAWAFQSLSLILTGSRGLLAVQYTINIAFLRPTMNSAVKGLTITAIMFWTTTVCYFWVCQSRTFSPKASRKISNCRLDVLGIQTGLWTPRSDLDCLVRSVWSRNVDGIGSLLFLFGYWLPGHPLECQNGPSHPHHYWRGCHCYHAHCEQDCPPRWVDQVVVCPYLGGHYQCGESLPV